jgi:hypothetical protein
MDSQNLNNWIQTATGIAVVVGLILVIVELKQGRDAIRSQLSSEGFTQIEQFRTSMLGEQAAEVIARACYSPNELTPTDLVVLDNYYSSVIGRNYRMKRLADRGGFYSEDDWKAGGSGWGLLFETAAGRAYWETFPIDAEIKVAGDEQISTRIKNKAPDCRSLFETWKQRVAEITEAANSKIQPLPDE